MASVQPQSQVPGATRLRLKRMESADLYRRLEALKAYEKSGNALTRVCEQVYEQVSDLSLDSPANPYRAQTLNSITTDHVAKVFKKVMKERVPPSAWKQKLILNDAGEEVPQVDANGSPVFELDSDGNRIFNSALDDENRVYYKSLISLQSQIRKQQASSTQSVEQARNRARQTRIARQRAAQKRRESFAKQKKKIKKRLRNDRKREKIAIQRDEQYKRTAASAAVASSNASIAMANSMSMYVQHVTGMNSVLPSIEPPIALPTFSNSNVIETSSSSDDTNSREEEEEISVQAVGQNGHQDDINAEDAHEDEEEDDE